MLNIKIKKLHPEAVIPSYGSGGAACFDLTAISMEEENRYIQYGTGLAMEIPRGYAGLLFPRSSVTKMDLMLKNSVGIIDSDYRGEICFRFHYIAEKGREIYSVGDRIGQMIILPYPKINFLEVGGIMDCLECQGTGIEIDYRNNPDTCMFCQGEGQVTVPELSNTNRGEGGFGSTGK